MKDIRGRLVSFLPSSLVDYPGHMAAVGFLQGCNLKCGYCHNMELLAKTCPTEEEILYEDKLPEFLTFIKENKIEYVVLTGGDPLSYPSITQQIVFAIKEVSPNTCIKLDTNGNTDLAHVVGTIKNTDPLFGLDFYEHLNYIAIDIKGFTEEKRERINTDSTGNFAGYNGAVSVYNLDDAARGRLLEGYKINKEFRFTAWYIPSKEEMSLLSAQLEQRMITTPLYVQPMNTEKTLREMKPLVYTDEVVEELANNLSIVFTDVNFRGF